MPLYQLERQLRAFDVELRQIKGDVKAPDGEICKFFYFVKEGRFAPTSFTRRSDLVSDAECERIRRNLGV